MYRLKPGVESFTVMDGPFAGRTFESGQGYAEIPPQDAGKFVNENNGIDTVEKPAKADRQKAAPLGLTSEKSEV